jgi:ribonuclease HII
MVELILGIDDAGRGPVLGPMVLAGVLLDKTDEPILKEWGAKDSKQLSAEKREEIAKKIKEKFKFHAELTTPEEIDSRLKMGINLNKVEAIKSAKIINELLKDINEKIKVIIDCPSPNTEAWKLYVLQHLDKKELIELSCEHKADVNHLSCSAASIIAKTTRDSEIEDIKKKIGINFGSGYCSDPLTCKFLEEHFEEFKNKGLMRTTWDTFAKAQEKKEQKKLF